MLNNITIGRYINKSSVVHKLNPVFKIISLIIMIISIFFIDSYIDITLLSMYLLLTMLYSDIDIKVYLKNIYGIKIFLIFIFIIDLIFFNNLIRYSLFLLSKLLVGLSIIINFGFNDKVIANAKLSFSPLESSKGLLSKYSIGKFTILRESSILLFMVLTL